VKNGLTDISFREQNLVTVICLGAMRNSRPSIQEYFHIIESFTLLNSLSKIVVIKKGTWYLYISLQAYQLVQC